MGQCAPASGKAQYRLGPNGSRFRKKEGGWDGSWVHASAALRCMQPLHCAWALHEIFGPSMQTGRMQHSGAKQPAAKPLSVRWQTRECQDTAYSGRPTLVFHAPERFRRQ